MGAIWAVNTPTAKADPPPVGPFCADVTVCNESAPCDRICTGPEGEASNCLFYGVCTSATPPPTPTPTPYPYQCQDVCSTSTSCDTSCNRTNGSSTTCGGWGVCAASTCNPSSCQTQCCAAGCAAKPTFSASPLAVVSGGWVTFTMTSANTDPNDSAWNFGDDTPEVWNQGQVTHRFDLPAGEIVRTYQVRLTAWDLVCGTWAASNTMGIHVGSGHGPGGEFDK